MSVLHKIQLNIAHYRLSMMRNVPKCLQCCQRSIALNLQETQRNGFVIHCQHRLNDTILLACKIMHNNLASIVNAFSHGSPHYIYIYISVTKMEVLRLP